MNKKKNPRYKESELTAEIILEFDSIASLVGIPKVMKLEQEKIIAPIHTTARSKALPRVDLLATHMDNELTIVEIKVFKSIHDMTQGIAQLLTYREYAESCWKSNQINLLMICNEITVVATSVVERYRLPITLIEFGEQKIISGRLRANES